MLYTEIRKNLVMADTRRMLRNLLAGSKHKDENEWACLASPPARFIFILVNGFLTSLGTALQLLFPVAMFLGCFFFVPYCY